MPPVVVRAAFDLAGAHRQHGLRAIQRLNLRFLIDTEHDGMRRRMHVQADDVPHLVDEQRIGRQLERLGAMRLQAKRAPDLLNRRAPQPARFRHAAAAPVRLAARRVSSVRTITCSICSSLICRGVPGRGSSYSPSSRSRINRPRHLHTVTCDIRRRFATTLLSCPSAHARMIRARRARVRRRPRPMGQRVQSHAFVVASESAQSWGVPVPYSPPCRRVRRGRASYFTFFAVRTLESKSIQTLCGSHECRGHGRTRTNRRTGGELPLNRMKQRDESERLGLV